MHQSTSITHKRPNRSSSLLLFPTPLAQPETMLWAQTAVPVAQHNDLHITHNSCPTSTVFSSLVFLFFSFLFFSFFAKLSLIHAVPASIPTAHTLPYGLGLNAAPSRGLDNHSHMHVLQRLSATYTADECDQIVYPKLLHIFQQKSIICMAAALKIVVPIYYIILYNRLVYHTQP